jgi:negative regulator of flagellin synthesis FlgM
VNVNDALKSGTGLQDAATAPTRSPGNTAGSTSTAVGTQSTPASTTPNTSDSVRLSTTYQTLEAKVTNTGGTFDAKKVAEIKAAIASGQFQIDPEKIATGLLDTVKGLIGARK